MARWTRVAVLFALEAPVAVENKRGSGTPKDVVARLSAELQRIQATPEFREQPVTFGMEPFPPQPPEQFTTMIAANQPRRAMAIKDSGAKVE